ncbi:MAG: response regulator, partial [Saprospiraceae bacterium]|nr:response regulator [Saprospiraceae bacterium]
ARGLGYPVDDLLPDVFLWQANIAEQEGRLVDALRYTKKHYEQKAVYDSRSAGFDLKNHFLKQEKEKLTAEKEKQALELRLHKVQLRNSLIIAGLVFLLAAGLFIGFYRQRQGKRELAEQNVLIRQQAEQLKNLDAAKSRFFANVSHELRTPLTLLLGPVQSLLLENKLTKKQTNLLQMARRSGAQLSQLIDEILDLRKIEMGKMTLAHHATALAPFFRNYFAQFDSLAEQRHIHFSFETNLDPGQAGLIDREKCRQILYNLLSNAFKFTPTGGSITVGLHLHENRLRLQVDDNGPGIPPEDLPRVFDRFFQSSRPDKPAEGGTGIGLNLCQEYARLLGGDASAENTPGAGASIRVQFPVQLVALPAAMASSRPGTGAQPAPDEKYGNSPQPQAASETGQQATILVVEDHVDLREYIRLSLSEKYRVLTAENGRVALDLLAEPAGADVALVLSDLMMPVLDGYQLLEKLKSDEATSHLPVIMLTARAEKSDRLKALRIGVDDYLTKPFDLEELSARIENLLQHQAARQQEAALASGEGTAGGGLSPTDREWLEGFETYTQQHFSEGRLSVSYLAHHFTMSESTLLRQLKRLTGLTPQQYLQEIRFDAARQLLENRTYDTVTRVAAEVGYSDVGAFSRHFQARFGKLPSEVLNFSN